MNEAIRVGIWNWGRTPAFVSKHTLAVFVGKSLPKDEAGRNIVNRSEPLVITSDPQGVFYIDYGISPNDPPEKLLNGIDRTAAVNGSSVWIITNFEFNDFLSRKCFADITLVYDTKRRSFTPAREAGRNYQKCE